MAKYTTIGKIGSALITNIELCKLARKLFKTLIISTGMSSEEEIENCVTACDPDVIMHSNSCYPCPVQDLNLNYIKWLQKKYPHKQISYSSHEYGLVTTYAAVALGAKYVERHVTLDRNMWGSDQKSSVMPVGIFKLAKGIRAIEQATKYKPQKRILFEGELKKRESLRKKKY
jgi:N-acetylneuraminate synthase